MRGTYLRRAELAERHLLDVHVHGRHGRLEHVLAGGTPLTRPHKKKAEHTTAQHVFDRKLERRHGTGFQFIVTRSYYVSHACRAKHYQHATITSLRA